ncbi:MAG: hypothetical protein RIE73_25170 [Coleofasciculus sp. C1-SOL-03]|jgi:hypothetical protein|uniref:hypothetical protein n=1 Tax=Coleofasciculus sp. C1-SOL-03 TaxID=3069522 RepID=UPI0032F8DA64
MQPNSATLFSWLFGFTASSLLCGGLSAQAQTPDSAYYGYITVTPSDSAQSSGSTTDNTQPTLVLVQPQTVAAATSEVAQVPVVNPLNILGRSYIGAGGNIGLDGEETNLGEGSFVIVSKAGFTDNFSVHNAVMFGDETTTSLTLSLNFPIKTPVTGQTIVIPFAGGGVLLQPDDDWEADPLVSGGVDVPIPPRFTGTVRVNVAFPEDDETDVGLVLGVGYNLKLF